MKEHLLACLAALVVQPILFLALMAAPYLLSPESTPWNQVIPASSMVVLFAFVHLLFFGLPAFFLLRWRNWLNARTMALAGLLAGIPLIAVIGWPPRHGTGFSSGGNWHGEYREFIIDGMPTLYGWLSYLEGVALWGLHGVAGALAFYFVWRRLRPNNSFKPKPLRGSA